MSEGIEGSSGVKTEGNKIFISGNPEKATKEAFFSAMSERMRMVTRAEYDVQVGTQHSMAHFNQVVFRTPEGKRLEDAEIIVCKDDFIVDGVDYTDLIPITVHHELTEAWLYAKTGYSLSPAPKSMGQRRVEIGHGVALRQEWDYAVSLGKADRYMNYIKAYAEGHLPKSAQENIIKENEQAKQIAESRALRKSKQ